MRTQELGDGVARNVGDFVVEWIFLYAPAEDFPDEKGTHTPRYSTLKSSNTVIESSQGWTNAKESARY